MKDSRSKETEVGVELYKEVVGDLDYRPSTPIAMVAYALGPKIRDIGSKVFSKSRFNNTFDEFRYERQIRNRSTVSELVLIKIRFLSRGAVGRSFFLYLRVKQRTKTVHYNQTISQLPNLCMGIRRICIWVRYVSRCYRP